VDGVSAGVEAEGGVGAIEYGSGSSTSCRRDPAGGGDQFPYGGEESSTSTSQVFPWRAVVRRRYFRYTAARDANSVVGVGVAGSECNAATSALAPVERPSQILGHQHRGAA